MWPFSINWRFLPILSNWEKNVLMEKLTTFYQVRIHLEFCHFSTKIYVLFDKISGCLTKTNEIRKKKQFNISMSLSTPGLDYL